MKVLLVNGSPREKGCTYTALNEIKTVLEQQGINAEIFHIKKVFTGCKACLYCRKHGKCVVDEDDVNIFIEKAKEADGFVFGSPVHYASASGNISSFLDRCFYSNKSVFEYKPGAAIVSCRRAGSTAAFEQLNKYFTITNMPVVSSNYWNMVHGAKPEDVLKDEEGMQTMRNLGLNMAWILKCLEIGKKNGIALPKAEERIYTNFIR